MTIRQEHADFWRNLHLDNLDLLQTTYAAPAFATHAGGIHGP